MLVLELLSRQEMYGYQIINELSEQSGQHFVLKEGTLYPILYRLEDDKMVESRWSETEGRRVPRKYYTITDEGREALCDIKDLWRGICRSVDRMMED